MSRLFFLIYSIAGVTCAGIGLVIALTMGLYTLPPILISAGAGALLGLAASLVITRRLLLA